MKDDTISRAAALDAMETWDKFGCDPDGKLVRYDDDKHYIPYVHYEDMVHAIKHLPSAQPDADKYEYHYDHTDCIWYRPEARNRCPVTCAQYRDGWNDAMNYIFRDGKGYTPYRRGEQYEE